MVAGLDRLALDLESARFRAGAARGRWTLLGLEWPQLFVRVASWFGDGVVLKMDCSDYPHQPPTAMPWDVERSARLDFARWPRGGRVAKVFRPDWKDGTALYLPCDRLSIEGHPNWLSEFPSYIWQPERGVVQYLEIVHELLQSHELEHPAT